jgi:ribosomal protein S18 acetylase RimI-like enzyme
VVTVSEIQFREALPQDDEVIAYHFYQLWRDNDVPVTAIDPNWQDIIFQFLAESRRELDYRAFVAVIEGKIIGSAGCQRFAGLYPLALAPSYRQLGYIWGVYVEPDYRRRGIAKHLTQMTIAHLKSLGCTRAVLHASPSGKPVYTCLGFIGNNEMRLDLI